MRAGPQARARRGQRCRGGAKRSRLDAGPVAGRPFGPVPVAKAYRLLRAVLETAFEHSCRDDLPARAQDRDEAIAKALGGLWVPGAIRTPRPQLTKHDCDRVARLWPGVPQQRLPCSSEVPAGAAEMGFRVGAGEGNRTLMTSLEGWGSAIELRPRGGSPPGVAYRFFVDPCVVRHDRPVTSSAVGLRRRLARRGTG